MKSIVMPGKIGSSLLRWAGGILAPAGERARLSILIFHRVLADADPLRFGEVTAEAFHWQMELVSKQFNVLPLGEAVACLKEGRLPARALCITFDDGYLDNWELALPILKRWGLPATFFVATGFLNGGIMWNDALIETVKAAPGPELDLSAVGLPCYAIGHMDQRRDTLTKLINTLKHLPLMERQGRVEQIVQQASVSLPDNLMMNAEHVRVLYESGMEIGGHTANHPILASLSPEAARQEMVLGKNTLEDILGEEVKLFAYPNGRPGRDYNSAHASMASELGFTAAVSTAWGAARKDSDIYQLPRFTPWDKTPVRYALRLFHNITRTADLSD